MSKLVELFGRSTQAKGVPWHEVVAEQDCPFTGKPCYKVRKSQPKIAIGSCTVRHRENPVIICPERLLEKKRVFLDSLHLLAVHQPGNDLHLVSEVAVPGGSVDYVLASVRRHRVVDFVGVEFQTLDTTGTVWPERQRFLHMVGLKVKDTDRMSEKSYGMNWKMTAKTILVQLHHKLGTFEHINRRLVLVLQDCLLEYMQREFQFDHLERPARTGDSMHFHSYRVAGKGDGLHLSLRERLSTDMTGLARAIGLQAETRVEFDRIARALEVKISDSTLLEIA